MSAEPRPCGSGTDNLTLVGVDLWLPRRAQLVYDETVADGEDVDWLIQFGEAMADLCRLLTLLAESAGTPLRAYLAGCSPEMLAEVRDWQVSAGWLPTPAAARIYGCTDSYMRRLARTRLAEEGHARRRHDGTWEVSCGAIRNLRRRS